MWTLGSGTQQSKVWGKQCLSKGFLSMNRVSRRHWVLTPTHICACLSCQTDIRGKVPTRDTCISLLHASAVLYCENASLHALPGVPEAGTPQVCIHPGLCVSAEVWHDPACSGTAMLISSGSKNIRQCVRGGQGRDRRRNAAMQRNGDTCM